MATEQTQLRTPDVQETLTNLGQNKRLVLIGAGVITLIITLLIVAFAWTRGASKGNEIDLVKRIDQGRAFEVISKLKANDLEAKMSDSDLPGKVNVKVYQKDFDKAAIALSRSDLLQEDGFNLFDKSDWAASDYDKRIKMMRAVNGDLSRIISRMTGIKWSTVRVNIPEPQLFSQFQAATTATVQVELPDEAGKLNRSQVRSIINLLVGYVPNLQKNNISIIDTNGETYSTVETEEIAASELLEESERVNKMVQKRIEEYLQPLLGASNYIVRVSSDISRNKIQESATTFADGVIGQEQVGDERLGANGGADQAVGPALPGVDGGKGYTRTNRVTQKYPSYKQKTVTMPPGRITKISVAVALNSELLPRISTRQLREGIAAITSPNTTADDIKITVAEFATNKPKAGVPKTPIFNIGNFLSQTTDYFKKLPRWAGITIAVIGLLIILGSFRRPAVQEPSTVSQINQSMQKQFQRPEQQLSAQAQEQVPGITQAQPDFTGILTGLKEAAVEKPEFLASKLQIWLEEGTPAGRV
ncbi:MAG: flagellar M-ring protein FliF [Candidatus Melainabacteria bacterium]|nr:flagellar M-ring protein FliF [Candidatus Melainabacteria bacterium]